MAITSPPKPDTLETHGEFLWLRADTLTIDARYQRTIREVTVLKIMREFDPDLLGALYVSERSEIERVVLDGQQRLESVVRMGYGDQLVPCLVFRNLTVEQEALMFLGYNGPRTKPRPSDMYRAALAAGDKAVMEIQSIIDRLGLTIGDGSGPARVQSIAAVRRVYEAAGPSVLERTLTVCVRAWGGANKRDALSGDAVAALAVLIARHDPDDGRLVRALVNEEPHELLKRGKTIYAEFGSVGGSRTPIASLVAGLITGLYNKGLPASKKISWDTQLTGVSYWRSASAPPSEGKLRKERVKRANTASAATSDAVLAKAYKARADGARWGEVHRLIENASPDFAALETATETARNVVLDYAARTGKPVDALLQRKRVQA